MLGSVGAVCECAIVLVAMSTFVAMLNASVVRCAVGGVEGAREGRSDGWLVVLTGSSCGDAAVLVTAVPSVEVGGDAAPPAASGERLLIVVVVGTGFVDASFPVHVLQLSWQYSFINVLDVIQYPAAAHGAHCMCRSTQPAVSTVVSCGIASVAVNETVESASAGTVGDDDHSFVPPSAAFTLSAVA